MIGELTVDGVRLEARWFGPPPEDAPTLVFLHEGLGSVSLWRDFPDRLAAATGCGALIYSRQGYGNSDPCAVPRPLSYMHDEAARLPRVLDAAGVRQAILVGHSDGGSIALIHAGGGIGHDRILALALMAPHVIVEDCCVEAIAQTGPLYEAGLRERLLRHHGDNVDCAFWGWNRAWLDPEFHHWDIRAYLPCVTMPTLVIQGEQDEYGTAVQYDSIAALASGPVEVVTLANCGHSPYRDQPDRTLAAMAAFVARVMGGK